MIALLLIGLAVGAGDLQHRAPGSLSGPDVATQISLGIQAAEHYRAPPAVTCPAQEPVRNGWTFTCRESQGGVSQMVLVTEIDGRGRLKWQIQPVL